MTNPIRQLLSRITKKTSSAENLVYLGRALGCIGDLVGRDYEIFDAGGKLVYRIHQKSFPCRTTNELMRHMNKIIDKENQARKPKGGRRR